MANKPVIVRTEVVVVDSQETNQYGDLLFTDRAGKQHKVSNKRDWLFDKVIDGAAITLGYAVYMDREYLADILDVANQLPPPVKPQIPADAPKPTAYAEKVPTHREPAPQEIGMCWNNVGAGVRDGSIERDFPKQGVSIKSQYYTYIFKTTGIKTKEE